jgi:LmbE family N-acetylglucosaminyl deacetylase
MYEVGVPLQPNQLLDITNFWPRKKAAMACFNSQLAIQRYDKHINGLNIYRSYTLPPNVQAAEAYYLVKGNEDWQNILNVLQQLRI